MMPQDGDKTSVVPNVSSLLFLLLCIFIYIISPMHSNFNQDRPGHQSNLEPNFGARKLPTL